MSKNGKSGSSKKGAQPRDASGASPKSTPKRSGSGGAPAASNGTTAKVVIWVFAAVAVAALALLVLRPASGGGGVKDISADELLELTEQDVLIVDVRSPGEYEQGHVAGAVNVPYTEIFQEASRWDKSRPIALYCLSGDRSGTALSAISGLGFDTVYHFSAGLQMWGNRPLVTGNVTPPADTGSTAPLTTPVMYEFYSDG